MDERLERALEFAKYRTTIENQRANLKRRFKAMCTVHHSNGVFTADQTTIAFVAALISNNTKNAVVVDKKDNPIEVKDLKEFQALLIDTYMQATNEYASEHQKLAKARNIKKAMNWK